ncbi:outer membrane beta-barrel protein [Flavobacterium davisii]|uniref:PorT family protein n=1 Tax=Flavobacterium columnare TaxID=996 RepID=A0A8G0KQH5_9FLAO|nr:outer membrane beta-barrel protein [Flavobacterium davisii]QYS88226.1 PorT family protein [Flavobacterium davisii]
MKAFYLFIFIPFFGFTQNQPEIKVLDSLYREDQFYFGITYNVINNKPQSVSQNSTSGSIFLGFLRDMPINKLRTFAVAPCLGFSYSNFKQNLLIKKNEDLIQYSIIPKGEIYDKNRFSFVTIDVPLEFRWRNSTPQSHRFWRVYGGIKASYVLYNQSQFVSSKYEYKVVNNPDFNRFLYSVYLTAGYNSGNIYLSYGLNDFFRKAFFNESSEKIRSLNLGLIFYIL